MTDEEKNEIARLISEGYTEGRLDTDNNYCYWSLKIERWSDEDSKFQEVNS